MTLYALSDRPQAQRHIYGQGVQSFRGDLNEVIEKATPLGERMVDEAKRLVGKSENALSANAKLLLGGLDIHKMTKKDVESLIDQLTPDQRACVKDLKKFLHDTVTPWGNAVTQELYLYNMFEDLHYFPIETVKTLLPVNEKEEKEKDAGQMSIFSILNKGFTKQVDEKAANPIVIRNIFEVFMNHAFDMANYGGMGVAVSDTIKWLNYKRPVLPKGRNIALTESDLEDYLKTGGTLHTRDKKEKMAALGKKPILTSLKEIYDFMSDVVHGKALGEVRAFGKVGSSLANAIKAVRQTLDLQGKYLELSADDLREAYKRHAEPKEAGDIPLSESDFQSIPKYLDTFDGVLSVNEHNGKVEIHIYKEIDDGYVRILTISSKERNSLQVTKLIGVSKEKFERKYGEKIKKGRNTGSPRGQTELSDDSNPSTKARHTAGALPNTIISQNSKMSTDETKNVAEAVSVRSAMEEAYGEAAYRYIKNFLMSIEGTLKGTDGAKLLNKLTRNVKIASVGANLRVVALPLFYQN